MSGTGAPTNFATNQGGGTLPQGSYYGDNPSASVGSSVMMQPGQYTPFTTPSWLTQGLQTSSAPLQSTPMTDFGVWNSGPGMQTNNQYGPQASSTQGQNTPWGAPGSMTPNYGNSPYIGGPSPYNNTGPGASGPPPNNAAGNPTNQGAFSPTPAGNPGGHGNGSNAANWQAGNGFQGLGNNAAQKNPAIEAAMQQQWSSSTPQQQQALYNSNPGLFGNMQFRQFSGVNNNWINATDQGNAAQNQNAAQFAGMLKPGQAGGGNTGISPYITGPNGRMIVNPAFTAGTGKSTNG